MKKYIIRLTDEERRMCEGVISKLKGSSQKARRARILRQVDANVPNWTDRQVADAFHCSTRTVENVRRRCVLEGFQRALDGRKLLRSQAATEITTSWQWIINQLTTSYAT